VVGGLGARRRGGLVQCSRIRCRRLSGAREIRTFAKEFLGTWDEVRIEIVDGPVEVREGLLIAENVAYVRGRDGIEVQARSAWLITIRDGEQTSLTLYQTKQEALEAAGLSE
jgi:ketosteroid isomerase-like protein